MVTDDASLRHEFRGFFLIENLNENLNAVLPKNLIFDEALDEVLYSQ